MIEKSSEFAPKVIDWQVSHGRHGLPWQDTRDPYPIWVSEIMLQQTQVGAVVAYFERFMRRFPDIRTLALATEDDVLQRWSGLGYYARARNLRLAASRVVEDYGGEFPRTAKEMAELPGIGRSTACAIAAFAFGERGAILDGNVKRVLARRFGIEGYPGSTKVEARLWDLAEGLLPLQDDGSAIRIYTQGIMDLGATICTRTKPLCGQCPLAAGCVAREGVRTAELPTPRPPKAYPSREATWLVLLHEDKVMLERRPSQGLWGGLWTFPESGGGDPVQECLSRFGCELAGRRPLPSISHAFTHFRLQIAPLLCDVRSLDTRLEMPGRAWMAPDAAARAAVPAPVRELLRAF